MANVMFINNDISVYQSLDGYTTNIRNLGKYTVKIHEKFAEDLVPLTVLYRRTQILIKRYMDVNNLFFETLKNPHPTLDEGDTKQET